MGGGMRTKPPKVKLPGLTLPPKVPPALWATVSVGACASQAALNLAAVSQPSKVEQHSAHSWPSMPAQPLRVAPHSGVSSCDSPNTGTQPLVTLRLNPTAQEPQSVPLYPIAQEPQSAPVNCGRQMQFPCPSSWNLSAHRHW